MVLEHTFFNSPGMAWGETRPIDLATPLARQWLRLADIRGAFYNRAVLGAAENADLDLILARLPPPWQALLVDPEPQRAPWAMLPRRHDHGSLPLLQGPDPLTGDMKLWELWPSGRLHALGTGVVPLPMGPSRPVCVSLRPKDRSAWVRADYLYEAAQRLLPADERQELLEPWLLGIWADMDLDPAVWGIHLPHDDPIALADITVRHARRLISHRLTLEAQRSRSRDFVRGYAEMNAAWPKAWRLAPADAPSPSLDHMGLAGLEERWRLSAVANPIEAKPAEVVNWRTAGLHRQHPPPAPRPSREERAAVRDLADAHPPLLRPGFEKVWRRLVDSTLHRPFRITCWQLLHGSLGCKAFLNHVRRPAPRHPPLPSAPPYLACL